VNEVTGGRVDVADHHETECHVDLASQKVDDEEVETDDEDAIGLMVERLRVAVLGLCMLSRISSKERRAGQLQRARGFKVVSQREGVLSVTRRRA
jgi:hypothetical protein